MIGIAPRNSRPLRALHGACVWGVSRLDNSDRGGGMLVVVGTGGGADCEAHRLGGGGNERGDVRGGGG